MFFLCKHVPFLRVHHSSTAPKLYLNNGRYDSCSTLRNECHENPCVGSGACDMRSNGGHFEDGNLGVLRALFQLSIFLPMQR